MKTILYYTMAVLAVTSASCSNQRLYPVSGRVTYKDVPAAGAALFFYRQGADPMTEPVIMGIVQADGSFDVVCGSLGKGGPAGEYDVLIEWKQSSGLRTRGRPQLGPDKLRGRYANRSHPLLHATIEARANQLPTFELADATLPQSR